MERVMLAGGKGMECWSLGEEFGPRRGMGGVETLSAWESAFVAAGLFVSILGDLGTGTDVFVCAFPLLPPSPSGFDMVLTAPDVPLL